MTSPPPPPGPPGGRWLLALYVGVPLLALLTFLALAALVW